MRSVRMMVANSLNTTVLLASIANKGAAFATENSRLDVLSVFNQLGVLQSTLFYLGRLLQILSESSLRYPSIAASHMKMKISLILIGDSTIEACSRCLVEGPNSCHMT